MKFLPLLFTAITLTFSQATEKDCNDVLALAAVNAVPYEPAKGPGYLMWTTDGTYTMYGRSENHIYINKNGLLSFGGNVSSLDHKMSDLPPFIAGFWSDISFANENSVIGFTERNHSLSQHNITKACITQLLREGFGGSMAGFELTDFIIVTWKDAAHSDSDKTQTVSFHMILASMEGSTETYALLLYADIGWDESIITKDVTVGFNTGDGQFLYIKEPGMQSDMLSMTNARRYGKYVYRIDGDEIMEPTMAQRNEDICYLSYNEDKKNFQCSCTSPRHLDDNKINCFINCGGICDPDNGTVLISSSTEGGVATYFCDNGYELEGNTSRECLPDGQWSGNETFCKDKPKPTPLTLRFINDTPIVSQDFMMAKFTSNIQGVHISCTITQLGITKECSSGSFTHRFNYNEIWKHMTKKYILHVKATDPNTNEVVTLTGSFRVFGHQENYFCTINMINTGMQPIQRGGYVEFSSVGRATRFMCKIDQEELKPEQCGEMVREELHPLDEKKSRRIYRLLIPDNVFEGEAKEHRLFVKPIEGCSSSAFFKGMAFKFTVPV